MPTVSAPTSRAISQMMGAAPVPVPPPMPQVMNTRSALARTREISSRFSSIACRPISGRAPAPSPRVSFFPIWIFTSDLELRSACASVLTEMNSTPSRRSSIMRLTALPPPPPTPTTFIRAFCDALSSNSKIIAGETPLLQVDTGREGATGGDRTTGSNRRTWGWRPMGKAGPIYYFLPILLQQMDDRGAERVRRVAGRDFPGFPLARSRRPSRYS